MPCAQSGASGILWIDIDPCPMRFACIVLAFLCTVACGFVGERLQTGDLVFVCETEGGVSNAGSMSEAIMSATGSITHVAVVEVDDAGGLWVIDATPKRGVERHSLESLIQDNPNAVFTVKRLRDTSGVSRFVENAKSFIGESYDYTFLPDNGAMYCSELIREAFRRPDGSPLFETAPMNFLASDGSVPFYWKQVFESLGMEVPQGVAGTNPQDLSMSPLLVEVNVSL